MEIEVVKFDNLGRGIGYLNNKIVFIPKTIPGDIVNIEIILEKPKYYLAKLINIIKPSKLRVEAKCPYFEQCGGCDFLNISLSETLEYKLNNINDLLKINHFDITVKEIKKCLNPYNYRNKISLKIVNGKIGFYLNETHTLIAIDYCYIVNLAINNVLKDISLLNIQNGNLSIRCNYKNELLIIIDSKDNIENIDILINKHNIVGIIQNNKTIYGDNYFIDKIGNYLFKVSYNSFFQVNPFICNCLLDLIKKYTVNAQKILDFYCGVGSLSIAAASNKSYVLGVEIVNNAIRDAFVNKKLNNQKNVDFICADTAAVLDKINNTFDTIILDPPRSGVHKNVLNKIIDSQIKKIIYVSCQPNTLIRDLKILQPNYQIKEFMLLDMFEWTHHVESFVVLERK